VEKGVQEMLATTAAHFDEGFKPKGLRPEDKPVPLTALPDEDQALIRKRYPERFAK
jgi:hypothetical protein